MDLTFRNAEPQDYERIIAIYNQAIPNRQSTADLAPITVADRTDWFAQHGDRYPLVVVETADGIGGWGSLSTFYSARAGYRECAEVSVYVATDMRSQGMGRSLLQFLIDFAKDHGFRRLVAVVFAHNEPSLAMCQRLGFIRWGFLPGVCNMEGVIRDVEILGLNLD